MQGVLFAYTSNSRIENVSTSDNDFAIYLQSSVNNMLQDNTASNNDFAIYLRDSNNNTLTSNTASNNDCAIYMGGSSNNTLTSNIASNNWCGIRISYSSNNTLINNTMSGNLWNLGVYSDSLSHYNQNMDTNNTVDGKTVYYWVNQKDKQIPDDAGFVGVVNSTNITVKNLTLSNNSRGVLFAYTNNARIENVSASNDHYGIYLYSSSNNTLTNNIANSNNEDGIYLHSSNNNTMRGNNVSYNDDKGIDIHFSDNNMIQNNNANSNTWHGICLLASNDNMMSDNNASSNGRIGISLSSSNNNTLSGNTANSNNYYSGIHLHYSNNNNITCNWMQNNIRQGFYLSDSTNNNISYNNIIENGNYNTSTGGWGWQFYNNQPEAADAKHNYWGAGMNNSTIDASIYDDEEGWGEVEFYPFETKPVQCPLTPEPPALLEADAGDDQHTSQGTLVMLDGSGSTGALTYNWTEDAMVLSDQISFSHEFSVGTHTITLTVSDGANTDNDTIIVRVNCPPVADAGEDRVISPDTYVKLDASGSKDLDGSIASYEWTEDGVPLSTRKSFNKIFGYGVHKVTLTVTDDFGDQDTDCMIVMILLRGDLNHDGIITPADAAIALQLAARGECAAGASADPRTTSLVSAAGATSVPVAQTTQTSALGMIVTDATCNVTLDARYGGAEAQEAVVTFTLTNTGDQPITVYQPTLPSPREGITLTALDNYPITIPSNASKTVQINVRVAGDVAEGTYNATAYFGDSTATITIDVRRLTRYNLDCEIADVSGDGQVTSLDALMIMQAAAGNTEDPITGCVDLDQSILRMYDEDGDGRIDENWVVNAAIDLDESRITQSDYDQVKYAYEHNCPVEPAE